MIEGACRFVIEDRFGITGARWSPDGAEVILKLRAVVVNGDLDDYMNYYKKRYRERAPPRPLRRGHHRPPQPRRMTETTRNNRLLKRCTPPLTRLVRPLLCLESRLGLQRNYSTGVTQSDR